MWQLIYLTHSHYSSIRVESTIMAEVVKDSCGRNFKKCASFKDRFRSPPKSLLTPGTNFAMFNDLGVYGTPGPVKRREPYNPTHAMRAMEKQVNF